VEIREQLRLSLRGDGLDDFLAPMACVGDEHTGGPIDPLVARWIVDLETFGPVPHDGRLAAHGDRLEPIQPLEYGNRFRRGQVGDNAAIPRFHTRYAFRGKTEFSGHGGDIYCATSGRV